MSMRDMLKKMMWPLLPKPWHMAAMETRYGLWSGVSALYSQSGRQLGESNVRPFLLNHHVPAQTQPCKYEGSRAGLAINVSALRIAMRHFDEALAITGAVRRFHLDRIGATGPAGLWDLFIIARASIALIAFRLRARGEKGATQRVPDALASQYQFISGIFMICRAMMCAGEPVIAHNRSVRAEELYAFADTRGLFLSPGGMACAGSTRKIMDFITFCIEGPPPTAQGDGAARMGPLAFVGDTSRWYAYALATVALDCLLEGERLRRHGTGQSTPAAIAIHEALGRYCASLPGGPVLADPPGDLPSTVLALQNAILDALQRPRIARIPAHILAGRLE